MTQSSIRQYHMKTLPIESMMVKCSRIFDRPSVKTFSIKRVTVKYSRTFDHHDHRKN